MGLDRDDIIVRRRLRAEIGVPSPMICLLASYQPTPICKPTSQSSATDNFRTETTFYLPPRFISIPNSTELTFKGTKVAFSHRLQRARQEFDPTSLGESAFLPTPELPEYFYPEVKKSLWAKQFAQRTFRYRSPASGKPASHQGVFGVHLVYVVQRADRGGRSSPALAEIYDEVRRQWLDSKRK